MDEIILKYIGNGQWLADVPARDLKKGDMTRDAVVALGGATALIASGLYQATDAKNLTPGVNKLAAEETK